MMAMEYKEYASRGQVTLFPLLCFYSVKEDCGEERKRLVEEVEGERANDNRQSLRKTLLALFQIYPMPIDILN